MLPGLVFKWLLSAPFLRLPSLKHELSSPSGTLGLPLPVLLAIYASSVLIGLIGQTCAPTAVSRPDQCSTLWIEAPPLQSSEHGHLSLFEDFSVRSVCIHIHLSFPCRPYITQTYQCLWFRNYIALLLLSALLLPFIPSRHPALRSFQCNRPYCAARLFSPRGETQGVCKTSKGFSFFSGKTNA